MRIIDDTRGYTYTGSVSRWCDIPKCHGHVALYAGRLDEEVQLLISQFNRVSHRLVTEPEVKEIEWTVIYDQLAILDVLSPVLNQLQKVRVLDEKSKSILNEIKDNVTEASNHVKCNLPSARLLHYNSEENKMRRTATVSAYLTREGVQHGGNLNALMALVGTPTSACASQGSSGEHEETLLEAQLIKEQGRWRGLTSTLFKPAASPGPSSGGESSAQFLLAKQGVLPWGEHSRWTALANTLRALITDERYKGHVPQLIMQLQGCTLDELTRFISSMTADRLAQLCEALHDPDKIIDSSQQFGSSSAEASARVSLQ